MYSIPNLILSLALCMVASISLPGLADDRGGSSPDVRAVLFYDPDSSQSQELFAFYLPELFGRYRTRLEIAGIDLSQTAGKRAYGATAEPLGLPPQPGEEPAVVVGNRAMVGLFAIAATLGDNFEELAKDPDAKRWPLDPALEQMLPGGIEDIQERVASEGAVPVGGDPAQSAPHKLRTTDQLANGLAILVLFGMVATLVHALVRIRRQGRIAGRFASGVLLLALLAGFGISGYTAYTALADVVPMCGPIGGCAAVQESEYSKLFGVPMGILGLVGYSFILVTWSIARFLSPLGGGWYWLPWAVALFGVLFSLRLTALEPFVIGATCLWCLGSAVSITLVLWLLSGYTRRGVRPS